MNEQQQLAAGSALLGLSLTLLQLAALQSLLDELQHWNQAYNLTAIRRRDQMLTHHLLDSLAVVPLVHGPRVADVGTGAGFPGLPLAIALPEWQFTLIDSNAKKTRFVAHVVRTLGLQNVAVRQARVEQLADPRPFDTVLARALAPIPQLLQWVRPLCAAHTRVLALKGKSPEVELAGLPAGWRVLENRRVTVPGLAAERHVVTLQP